MLIVAVSRGLAIPKYLTQLNLLIMKEEMTALVKEGRSLLVEKERVEKEMKKLKQD